MLLPHPAGPVSLPKGELLLDAANPLSERHERALRLAHLACEPRAFVPCRHRAAARLLTELLPHVKGQKRLELGLERRIRLVEQAAAEVLAEEADGCAKGGRPGGGRGRMEQGETPREEASMGRHTRRHAGARARACYGAFGWA